MSNNILLDAALGYAGNGFPVFPLNGKKPALPTMGKKFEKATTDVNQIREWWGGQYANCNIGIPTGPKSGFWVLDIDTKADANGVSSLNEIASACGEVPATAMQFTGSGRHLLFDCKDTKIKNSVRKIADGIDVRGDGGYIVVPPSIHPVTKNQYQWSSGQPPLKSEILKAPDWLVSLAVNTNKKADTEKSKPSAVREPVGPNYGTFVLRDEYLKIMQAENGRQEHALNTAAYNIGQLVGAGILDYDSSFERLQSAAIFMTSYNSAEPWQLSEIREKIERGMKDGMEDPRQIKLSSASTRMGFDRPTLGGASRVSTNNKNVPPEILELNKKHAALMLGGKFCVMNEVRNPGERFASFTFSTPKDFQNRYSNQKLFVGDHVQRLGHAWLNHPARRQYEGIVFEPGGAPNTFFNLWQGFPISPREGSCQLYLDHIRDNIAGADETLSDYILNFMADAIQNPATRPGVALVLRGEQGVGKGMFAKHFGALFDPHYVQVSNSRHLLGNFNAVLQDKLVVFADEAFWAGDKQAEGVLKALVTEDMNIIEQKGKDAFTVKNYIRLIVASNSEWVVPAGPSERRFCVIDAQSTRIQDHGYFQAIEEEMRGGGLEALMYFLLHRDLSSVNLRILPKTAALQDQKIHSMDVIEKWWLDCLMSGSIDPVLDWETPIETDRVFKALSDHSSQAGFKVHASQTMVGKKLRKLVGGDIHKRRPTVKKMNMQERMAGDYPYRSYTYTFPPLADCRKHFDKVMGFKTEWPEVEEEEMEERSTKTRFADWKL